MDPATLEEGGVLVKILIMSADPYMRGLDNLLCSVYNYVLLKGLSLQATCFFI